MKISQQSFEKICKAIASKKPAPGGGAASAISGALAASLVAKVAIFTRDKKDYRQVKKRVKKIHQDAQKLLLLFQDLATQDQLAFKEFNLKKKDKKEIEKVIRIPLAVAQNARKVLEMASFLSQKGSFEMVADARCALELGTACFYAALETIRVNLPLLEKGSSLEIEIREEIEQLLDQTQPLLAP